MKKKYLYNGQEYDEQQISDAAKQSGKTLDEYIKAAGIKVVDEAPKQQAPAAPKSDIYLYDGKEFNAQQVEEAAKQSGKSFEDYVGQVGLKKKRWWHYAYDYYRTYFPIQITIIIQFGKTNKRG